MNAQARKDGVGKLVKVWTAGLAAASSCGGCKENCGRVGGSGARSVQSPLRRRPRRSLRLARLRAARPASAAAAAADANWGAGLPLRPSCVGPPSRCRGGAFRRKCSPRGCLLKRGAAFPRRRSPGSKPLSNHLSGSLSGRSRSATPILLLTFSSDIRRRKGTNSGFFTIILPKEGKIRSTHFIC